jgi:hypothetical protein
LFLKVLLLGKTSRDVDLVSFMPTPASCPPHDSGPSGVVVLKCRSRAVVMWKFCQKKASARPSTAASADFGTDQTRRHPGLDTASPLYAEGRRSQPIGLAQAMA